jgi:hypothetical protein
VKTGGLGVSMRFMWTEEVGVVAVPRTPGFSLISVFAAGASLLNATSPSRGGDGEADGGDKGGYGGT